MAQPTPQQLLNEYIKLRNAGLVQGSFNEWLDAMRPSMSGNRVVVPPPPPPPTPNLPAIRPVDAGALPPNFTEPFIGAEQEAYRAVAGKKSVFGPLPPTPINPSSLPVLARSVGGLGAETGGVASKLPLWERLFGSGMLSKGAKVGVPILLTMLGTNLIEKLIGPGAGQAALQRAQMNQQLLAQGVGLPIPSATSQYVAGQVPIEQAQTQDLMMKLAPELALSGRPTSMRWE